MQKVVLKQSAEKKKLEQEQLRWLREEKAKQEEVWHQWRVFMTQGRSWQRWRGERRKKKLGRRLMQ